MTLIDDLLDLQIPNSLRISPTGTQVVFATTLSFGHVKGDKEISTLWLADTGKPGSARQLTSGQHHDRDPHWLPDGKSLAFLSDRAKPGRGCAIYILPLEGGREAYPATPAEDERRISQLEVSPDGKTIAFISGDEKAEARKRREEEKDDAQVWGEDWTYSRLRLLHLATKTVTMVGGGIEGHVCACVWNEAGTQLAFTEARTPDVESAYLQGTAVSTVDVRTEEVVRLCRFPNSVPEMVWAGDAVYFQGKVTPASVVSAYAVYRVGTGVAELRYERVAHGEENCAMGLVCVTLLIRWMRHELTFVAMWIRAERGAMSSCVWRMVWKTRSVCWTARRSSADDRRSRAQMWPSRTTATKSSWLSRWATQIIPPKSTPPPPQAATWCV